MYKKESFLRNPSIGFKLSGFLLFIAIAFSLVSIILIYTDTLSNIVNIFLSVVSVLLNIVSIFLIANSLVVLAEKIPPTIEQAKSTYNWLMIFLVATLISSFSDYISDILSMIVGLVALISQIVGFTRLNKTFRQMSYAYPPEGKLNHWIFPLYAYSSLLMVTLTFILAFMLAPTATTEDLEQIAYTIAIIITAVTLLITAFLGAILFLTGGKIAKYEPQDIFISQPEQGYPDVYYQPIEEPVKSVRQFDVVSPKFCSNCGEKVTSDEKFCFNCGSELD